MAKDVVIVPANGSISFSNNSVLEATIYNNNGDLYLSPNSGNVILGDGSPGNIEVGNTTTSVDFTFLGGGTITGGGNALDIGAAGDTINMNLSGVTYNFPNTVVTTSVYTASDILTKIKTVDGSGSGLDADLLDGGDWTTPGTIGSSIANTGSFTTLTAVNLSVTGNTTLGDAAADNITINANTITIAANSNIDAGTLFIDSLNNRVGIGTTAPARELHIVANTAGVDGIRLDNPNSGSGVGVETAIELYNAGNFMSKFSSFRDTNELRILNPQSGITSFYTANNERMRIAANGNIGVGTTAPAHTLVVAGAVYASADASSVSYYMPASAAIRSAGNMYIDADTSGSGGFTRAGTGDIILRTAAASERMRIVSNGNIGIGTSTPVGELEISNSGEPDIFLSRTGLANNHGASGVGQIYFRDSNNAYNTASIQSVGYMPGTSGILQFKTAKTGTLTARMTISEDGNVGIANTAPANKLFVTGDIGLDGISVRDTATTTTTATTQITLFEYPVATYDSCEVLIKAVSGGQRHVSKLLVTANSTVAIATEYGILQTGSTLYTVDTDVASSNTRIRITPASATSTVFKASYELITA